MGKNGGNHPIEARAPGAKTNMVWGPATTDIGIPQKPDWKIGRNFHLNKKKEEMQEGAGAAPPELKSF